MNTGFDTEEKKEGRATRFKKELFTVSDTISSMMESANKMGVRHCWQLTWNAAVLPSFRRNFIGGIFSRKSIMSEVRAQFINRYFYRNDRTSPQGEDVHFSDTHIIGTNQSLEKPYLRLTSVSTRCVLYP